MKINVILSFLFEAVFLNACSIFCDEFKAVCHVLVSAEKANKEKLRENFRISMSLFCFIHCKRTNFNLFYFYFFRYKKENSRSSQAAENMKRLLGYVSDIRMRYKLANELNFRDLGTSILEGDGGAFLRDVMVP